MAETSRQSHSAQKAGAACESAAGAHIKGWAPGDPAKARDTGLKAAPRRDIRANRGRETVWGGDLADPRLFYFRALLASGRFFSGGKRA